MNGWAYPSAEEFARMAKHLEEREPYPPQTRIYADFTGLADAIERTKEDMKRVKEIRENTDGR